MIISSTDEAQAELARLFAQSHRATGFTGAGISTECGVPDFRSPGSPWMKHRPIDFALFVADPLAREEAWRRKFAMDDMYAGARPGRGHRALASLVASGKMGAIITQNIDGLHQAAGAPAHKVIELHGNGTYAKCLECGARHELADVREEFDRTGAAPECGCGGAIKSATISFGQAMPEEEMRRAHEEATTCDLFLAIGSSLVVYPAAGFPVLAKRNGATLVIVNREETPLDDAADLVLRGDIGSILLPFATSQ
ncbi:MAG TPA: Sir2 family NAD-dependent protein deacetylase [Rhodoblastus sp.]|nr:Sir2 family NAD-dependent protein deacetylase [Rhodoblastus sp.]